MDDPVREKLETLIRERGDDYAGLSRLVGKNASYIQQYVKRGTPKRLPEDVRRELASYFGVPESELGAPPAPPAIAPQILVPRFAIHAQAGAGSLELFERPVEHVAFDARWLKSLGADDPKALAIIKVMGDSMFPTLSDGDDILVDHSPAGRRLRDGVFVLRTDDALIVKRLAVNPADRTVSIKSDNERYPDFEGVQLDRVHVVARVVTAIKAIQ
jgi:phage repressor protein C with HTH and peptisase S24 domain